MRGFLQAIYDEKIKMSDTQLHQIARDNGFDLQSREYRVLIISVPSRIDSPEDYRKYCVDLPECSRRFFSKCGLRAEIVSDYSGESIVLLMEEMSNQRVDEFAGELLDWLDTRGFDHAMIAVGKRVYSIAEIANSYRPAVNTLSFQRLYSDERCLFCDDIQAMLNLSTLQSTVKPDQVLQAFREGDIARLRVLVTAYAEEVRALSGQSIEGRHPTSIRRMFVELTVYVLHIASDMGVDVDAILKGIDPYNFLLANDKSTPMIIDWFTNMCMDLRSAMDEKAKSKERSVIQKTCAYLDEHITQCNLSLDDVAAVVQMTPSYFSKLFHKEMSIVFSRYVVQRRLEISKNLLEETELPVKEIAMKSGFSSANYFGTVFKKEYGISPQAYRQKADSD